MNYPRVLLINIERMPEVGQLIMRIKIGDEAEKAFRGSYDGSDEKYKFSSVEEELFMRLSELAVHRFCNAAIYQFELMGIIGAFVEGAPIPPLPIELGTTEFGMKRPSRWRIGIDRLRRAFLLAWYRWEDRRIRQKNPAKHAESK